MNQFPAFAVPSAANRPALVFDAFFETDDGEIKDSNISDDIGVFIGAIQLIESEIKPNENDELLKAGKLFGDFGDIELVSDKKAVDPKFSEIFNLSAKKQNDGKIEYQIYQGEDIDHPDIGIRFASVEPLSSDVDLVENLENILNHSIPKGEDNVFESGYLAREGSADNKGEDFPEAGILGRAIIDTLRFFDNAGGNRDTLKIKSIGDVPTTTIPEPSTTLASLLVLGVSGISLRKRKKTI